MIEPTTASGRRALQAIVAAPEATLLAVDFDGVLARIVPDPAAARADPQARAAIERLGDRLRQIAVITGRPARLAADLGGFRGRPGLGRLVILGQYGVERWDAETDELVAPPAPPEIDMLAETLPGRLAEAGVPDAHIENKARSLAVHLRQLENPVEAMHRVRPMLAQLADALRLRLEPGKHVLELRATGIDKGEALRSIMAESGAEQAIYIGDDLGDLPAFHAIHDLQRLGHPALAICSVSPEENALVDLADIVVDGVSGVADWLSGLADRLDARFEPPATS